MLFRRVQLRHSTSSLSAVRELGTSQLHGTYEERNIKNNSTVTAASARTRTRPSSSSATVNIDVSELVDRQSVKSYDTARVNDITRPSKTTVVTTIRIANAVHKLAYRLSVLCLLQSLIKSVQSASPSWTDTDAVKISLNDYDRARNEIRQFHQAGIKLDSRQLTTLARLTTEQMTVYKKLVVECQFHIGNLSLSRTPTDTLLLAEIVINTAMKREGFNLRLARYRGLESADLNDRVRRILSSSSSLSGLQVLQRLSLSLLFSKHSPDEETFRLMASELSFRFSNTMRSAAFLVFQAHAASGLPLSEQAILTALRLAVADNNREQTYRILRGIKTGVYRRGRTIRAKVVLNKQQPSRQLMLQVMQASYRFAEFELYADLRNAVFHASRGAMPEPELLIDELRLACLMRQPQLLAVAWATLLWYDSQLDGRGLRESLLLDGMTWVAKACEKFGDLDRMREVTTVAVSKGLLGKLIDRLCQ
ncbi:hypothetical protein V1514DRAFT_331794 [Lipomyces japonicus]|uniref:uncharacterized protein n=1 Tax=Lipomyces japonicus TaxID=56871 RepID=UPI0034CE1110